MDGSFRNSTIMEEVDIKPTSFFLEDCAVDDRLVFYFNEVIIEVDETNPVCRWDKIQIVGDSNVGKTYINFSIVVNSSNEDYYNDELNSSLSNIFDNLFVICKPNSEHGALPFVKNRKVDSTTIHDLNSRDAIMKPYKIIIDTDSNKCTVSGRMLFKFGCDDDNNDVIVSDIKVCDLKSIWKILYKLKPLLFKDTPNLHPDKVKYI